MKDIYPLTIIKDRYCGLYSEGNYTAWNMEYYTIPYEVDEDDIRCGVFWDELKQGKKMLKNCFKKPVFVGLGQTPQEALDDLVQKIENNIKK